MILNYIVLTTEIIEISYTLLINMILNYIVLTTEIIEISYFTN
jgi:hypothetical protein